MAAILGLFFLAVIPAFLCYGIYEYSGNVSIAIFSFMFQFFLFSLLATIIQQLKEIKDNLNRRDK